MNRSNSIIPFKSNSTSDSNFCNYGYDLKGGAPTGLHSRIDEHFSKSLLSIWLLISSQKVGIMYDLLVKDFPLQLTFTLLKVCWIHIWWLRLKSSTRVLVGIKMDIFLGEGGQKTGFLSSAVEEFAIAIFEVLSMPG